MKYFVLILVLFSQSITSASIDAGGAGAHLTSSQLSQSADFLMDDLDLPYQVVKVAFCRKDFFDFTSLETVREHYGDTMGALRDQLNRAKWNGDQVEENAVLGTMRQMGEDYEDAFDRFKKSPIEAIGESSDRHQWCAEF